MAGFDGEEDTLPGVNESRLALNFEAACQRLGLGLLLLIILLAVAGVFSNGYVSTATKENTAKTLTVNYERYGRLQTEYKLAFTAKGYRQTIMSFAWGAILIRHSSPAVLRRSRTACSAGVIRCT